MMRIWHSALFRHMATVSLLTCGVLLALVVAAAALEQDLGVQRTGVNQFTFSWNAFLSQGLTLQSTNNLVTPSWNNVGTSTTTVEKTGPMAMDGVRKRERRKQTRLRSAVWPGEKQNTTKKVGNVI
jgi:hypothetical protein